MQTLYLTDPTLTLEKIGRAVRVQQNGQAVARVTLNSLRQVFLFGHSELPPKTMTALAAAGVPVVWLTEHGRFVARVEGSPSGAPSLRREQYLRADEPRWVLENARAVLRCKLLAARGMLRRHMRNHQCPDLPPIIQELKVAHQKMACAPTLSRLRGLEGKAGALYFQAWVELLRRDLDFIRRTRRPAPDPVNALLSLAYGLVRIELESQLHALGLDARVGFLHVERGRRPALALDLLEEFRAEVCDRLVLRCFNLGLLQERHFVTDYAGACRLTAEGRQRFMHEYEVFLEKPWKDFGRQRINYRRLFHMQCREFCDAIRDSRTYRPHQPRI